MVDLGLSLDPFKSRHRQPHITSAVVVTGKKTKANRLRGMSGKDAFPDKPKVLWSGCVGF